MRTSSKNEDGVFEPFTATEAPVESFTQGRFGAAWRALSDFGGAGHVGFILEELAPGVQTNQRHYHLLEEEHVFILDGEVTLLLGEARYTMKAGDYVCFPAGQAAGHALLNETDAVCRYILVGERNPHDVCVYPDTGRVGVKLMKQGYRMAAAMDYWEGVEGAGEPETK
jgi:uncharacterized cupin superfamily protein